ncbi:hypothetical protein FH972_025452 [Carpinus fangiana]|uniref:Uncharacterized protein n=1 Tax=Carpinus fangiana TaxID=176857 RepID=A0A5N6L1G9_9ROSI|nr:hypothetical protein FH972_025452 [Carpinus fangiana]
MSCYYPNGAVALNHTACDSSVANSHCCAWTDACLTNSYCLAASGNMTNTLKRGSCTDSSWSDPACPVQCSDVSTETTVILNMASANHGSGIGTWCCNDFDQENNTCQDPTHNVKSPWGLANGRLIYDRKSGAIEPVTSPAPSSNTTCTSGPQAGQLTSSTREAAIGAAIGIPLALAVVVLSILYFRATQASKRLQLRIDAIESHPAPVYQAPYTAEKSGTHTTNQPLEMSGNSESTLLSGTPVAELSSKRES